MQVDLRGKTALIAGASSGFGASFAKLLAANGAKVYATARRTHLLERVVDEIRATGRQADAVPLDVRDLGAIRDVFARIGAVDIVVNNAGVTHGGPAMDTTEDAWSFVVDTNLRGAFFVAQQAARNMRDRGAGGSIINIASITAFRPAMHAAAYTIAKAGVVHMTKQLALEWARHGIRVNAIAPGFFTTDLTDDYLKSDSGLKMLKRIPMRRVGDLPELHGPLLLLASDASSYMTGAVIEVDGGHLAAEL
jgi:NAD(P)-dependent dehydrogenase (short-subunit alcohol dehydrogenase family)